VPTQSGSTAREVSRFRPRRPVVAAASKPTVLQQLALDWAVVPIVIGETQTLEELWRRTDALMVHKMDTYVAPLHGLGVEITPILRRGNPRDVIVQVATNLKADLLVLGSHSNQWC